MKKVPNLSLRKSSKGKSLEHYVTWPRPRTSMRFLSAVSLLRVRVPVSSLHKTSIPAISSMAVILLVMAPCCDMWWDPIAIVTDKTGGDRNTSNEKHQEVVNALSVLLVLDWVHQNDLNQHTNSKWAVTEVTNSCQHLTNRMHPKKRVTKTNLYVTNLDSL